MKYLLATLFASFVAANAGAATITFEDQALGETAPVSQGFTLAGGFQFVTGEITSDAIVATGDNGTQVFQVDDVSLCNSGGCGGAFITLNASGGGAFSYYGADVFLSGPASLQIFGTKVGGGLAAGAIGTGDWLNLEEVVFVANAGLQPGLIQQILEVDNVVVGAAVPIPASIWLLGSSLGILGWIRRKPSK